MFQYTELFLVIVSIDTFGLKGLQRQYVISFRIFWENNEGRLEMPSAENVRSPFKGICLTPRLMFMKN